MQLRSLSFEELVGHGVRPSFARVLSDPESYDSDQRIHIGRTNWDYYVPDNVSEIVPLWDRNADSIVRWTRCNTTEYVWLFHDDPAWDLLAYSEQGIMHVLWQEWAEFQESDDECRRFAEYIGFRHCEEALAIWNEDSETIDWWRLTLT